MVATRQKRPVQRLLSKTIRMTECIGTGLSGLVGSRVVEILSSRYHFADLSLETGVDITRYADVQRKLTASNSSLVIHFAAKTDVDSCEKDRQFGQESQTWKINVEATANIAQTCSRLGKRLIYISTDFVFDDSKDAFSESDEPNPRNFYGVTKYEGEKRVQMLGEIGTIVRISFPYRSFYPRKLDLVRAILTKLQRGEELNAITDQYIVPTFIDDIAVAIDILIRDECSGIYHVCGSQEITPFDLALAIAQEFSCDPRLVKKTTRSEYFKNRAYRPFKTTMKNDKIQSLGIKMHSVIEGLKEMKMQWQSQTAN